MIRVCVLASVALLIVGSARADRQVRLTAVGGGRMGGSMSGWSSDLSINESASAGLRLGVELDESRWVELFYSLQDSEIRGYALGGPVVVDVDLEYYHINVIQELDGSEALTPYVVGGLGLTRLSSNDGPVNSDLRFSLNAGIGIDLPVSDNAGFLVETRAYCTFLADSTYIGVGTGGGTIGFSGSALFQAEASAGVYLQF